jgi:hypothetical protein
MQQSGFADSLRGFMAHEKSLMIRLKADDKQYLQNLAHKRNETMTKVIEDLLEEHRRRSFFEDLAADYAALKKDSQAWQEELAEQKLWETTASDGLEDV